MKTPTTSAEGDSHDSINWPLVTFWISYFALVVGGLLRFCALTDSNLNRFLPLFLSPMLYPAP
jgi:hypothetical protein